MSTQSSEDQTVPEYGGPDQDAEDRIPVVFNHFIGDGEVQWKDLHLRGGMAGPAEVAPLSLAVFAIIVGGCLWAVTGVWQIGVTMIIASGVAMITHFFFYARSNDSRRPQRR